MELILLASRPPLDGPLPVAVIGGLLALFAVLTLLYLGSYAPSKTEDWGRLAATGYRHARRVVIGVVGVSVLLIGFAMLVLPGPAIVVIPLGLAILAIEFAWARRWLKRARQKAEAMRDRVRDRNA